MKKSKHHKEEDSCPLCSSPNDEELEPQESRHAENLIDRRDFMKTAALGAIGASAALSMGDLFAALPQIPLSPDAIPGPFPGRVVEVVNPEVVKEHHQVDIQLLRKMMEKGMAELTGKTSLAEAWKMFISSDDVVGIKLNCAGGPLCYSRPEILDEIIRGVRMAGVKDDNIIVWDRRQWLMTRCGYQVNRNSAGVKYYGPEVTRVGQEDMNGYDAEAYIESDIVSRSPLRLVRKPSTRSHFAEIMSQKVTKLINLPVLKDHGTAGVTLCLKNLGFGVVHNTARFHPAPYYGAPIIADVHAHPIVRKKTVLHILDGLWAVWNGGPDANQGNTYPSGRIFLGTDPVAIDQVCWQLIEANRKVLDYPPIGERAHHIAATARKGLGINDPQRISHLSFKVD